MVTFNPSDDWMQGAGWLLMAKIAVEMTALYNYKHIKWTEFKQPQ